MTPGTPEARPCDTFWLLEYTVAVRKFDMSLFTCMRSCGELRVLSYRRFLPNPTTTTSTAMELRLYHGVLLSATLGIEQKVHVRRLNPSPDRDGCSLER
jgi:hypothetical protein